MGAIASSRATRPEELKERPERLFGRVKPLLSPGARLSSFYTKKGT